MSFDYLKQFPLPLDIIPPNLKELLIPVGMHSNDRVKVACLHKSDDKTEYFHMLMAVVPGKESKPVNVLSESSEGVVEYGQPYLSNFGNCENFLPSISEYDYIVASWGDSSFFSFNLAEKVWMLLGLTPRCIGNDQQRLIYDNLSVPVFNVAEGEISTSCYWNLQRNVNWNMSNDYLRRYLWMRGARGVRVFYYETQMEDCDVLREIMNGEKRKAIKPEDGPAWYKLDIFECEDHLRLRLWASVEAVFPELCKHQTAEEIIWPDHTEPMTHEKADALIAYEPVYLDDRFLQKYEQNLYYELVPTRHGKSWWCNPSYVGQWCFTECIHVGRNLIKVPMRELYKPKPDSEILHAFKYALSSSEVKKFDLEEESVFDKVQRFVEAFCRLGNSLSGLGDVAGISKESCEITGFELSRICSDGWHPYQELCKLAQVVPLDMSQQDFLSRCKSLHELWQRVPNGFLRKILEKEGCPKGKIKELGSIKLLQGILNIVEKLNSEQEEKWAYVTSTEPEGWDKENKIMAPLFLNNDLRIADAHDAMEECVETMEKMGLDSANIRIGYGKAFDFVIDHVTGSFIKISEAIEQLLSRQY